MAIPSRHDNFDFLRLLAAGLVLVSHGWPLTGRHDEPLASFITFTTMGGLGVYIFFALSGYLVLGSWLRDPNVPRFAARRFLRIYPGLVVLVLITILLGPLVSKLSALEFWREPPTLAYLNVLLLFPMPFSLPGAFAGNPIPGVVNGSLWTLPIEASMYVALACMGAASFASRPRLILVTAIVLLGLSEIAWRTLAQPFVVLFMDLRYVLDLGAYFFAGAALYAYRGRFHPRLDIALVLVAVFLIANALGGGRIAMHLTLPYAVIAVAFARLPWIDRAGAMGDFSYGIYIYAYPIQQAVVHFSGNTLPLAVTIGIQALATLIAAALSWHFVENPALAMKPAAPRNSGREANNSGFDRVASN